MTKAEIRTVFDRGNPDLIENMYNSRWRWIENDASIARYLIGLICEMSEEELLEVITTRRPQSSWVAGSMIGPDAPDFCLLASFSPVVAHLVCAA
jgi:hypothetical protein